jgi:uncharacterized membrane-anchored protein YhcB (DUF1043 family)
MADEKKKKQLTPEEIKAVEAEIDTFGQKSIQHASENPELSAHYNRLYRASKMFLAKSAKIALAAKHKDINEKRRQAKAGTTQRTSSTPRT